MVYHQYFSYRETTTTFTSFFRGDSSREVETVLLNRCETVWGNVIIYSIWIFEVQFCDKICWGSSFEKVQGYAEKFFAHERINIYDRCIDNGLWFSIEILWHRFTSMNSNIFLSRCIVSHQSFNDTLPTQSCLVWVSWKIFNPAVDYDFFLTTKSSSLKYRKTERKNYTPRRKMRVIIDAYLTAKLRYIMLRCTVLCWSANYRVETLITFSSLFRNKEISYLVMMEKNRHEIFVLMRTSIQTEDVWGSYAALD